VFCAVALLAVTGALGEEWARFATTLLPGAVLAALQRTLELAPGRVVANPFGLQLSRTRGQPARRGPVPPARPPGAGPRSPRWPSVPALAGRRAPAAQVDHLRRRPAAPDFLGDLLPDPVSSLLFAAVVALLPAAQPVDLDTLAAELLGWST
jgi:hypothetical protein